MNCELLPPCQDQGVGHLTPYQVYVEWRRVHGVLVNKREEERFLNSRYVSALGDLPYEVVRDAIPKARQPYEILAIARELEKSSRPASRGGQGSTGMPGAAGGSKSHYGSGTFRHPGAPENTLREKCSSCGKWVASSEAHDC